jgi:catechol 2,3-dioxygenase-like lactoylglutathione lyase family enzyme
MLGDMNVTATIAVKNLPKAKEFYGQTLGLEQVDTEGDEAVTYRTGDSTLLVYRSQYAGTNQATAATWTVDDEDDIEDRVATLKSKGVPFEHYDMPGMTRQGEVHVAEATRAAWFRDPDGNILALVSR